MLPSARQGVVLVLVLVHISTAVFTCQSSTTEDVYTVTTLPSGNTTLPSDSTVLPQNRSSNSVEKSERAEPKIIGGNDAKQGEYPYQVSVRLNGWTLVHFCGGSIISEYHVLTAGHCVVDKNPWDLKVVAGDIMLDRSSCTSVKRSVAAIFVHEEYTEPSNPINDVAVLKLSTPFPVGDANLKFIRLISTPVAAGTPCTVTGWGFTRQGSREAPNKLQTVEVPVIPRNECFNEISLPEGMICAGVPEGGKDSCQGDSGGPLQCDGYLVGIVSWGIECAVAGYPGVYTDVLHYSDWIQEAMTRDSAVIFHGYPSILFVCLFVLFKYL